MQITMAGMKIGPSSGQIGPSLPMANRNVSDEIGPKIL